MKFQRNSTLFILISSLLLLYSCAGKPDLKTEKHAVEQCVDTFLLSFEKEQISGIENTLSRDSSSLFVFYNTEIEPCNSIFFIDHLKQYFISLSEIDIAPISQNIALNSEATTAWFVYAFDLRYDKEGFSEFRKNVRMSGICIKEDGDWKICQLHLSQPSSR